MCTALDHKTRISSFYAREQNKQQTFLLSLHTISEQEANFPSLLAQNQSKMQALFQSVHELQHSEIYGLIACTNKIFQAFYGLASIVFKAKKANIYRKKDPKESKNCNLCTDVGPYFCVKHVFVHRFRP